MLQKQAEQAMLVVKHYVRVYSYGVAMSRLDETLNAIQQLCLSHGIQLAKNRLGCERGMGTVLCPNQR